MVIFGIGKVKKPVVSVHFSDCVGCAVGEVFVEEADFFLPVAVGPRLALGEHE